MQSVDPGQISDDLMVDDTFQTFMISVLFNKTQMKSDGSNYGAVNIYKKETLWILGNLLGGPSEQICEIVLETQGLLDRILELCSQQTDYHVRSEALVALYNLCENHNSKYLPRVI